MNQRSSGVLLHPTSLFNRFPIGDLGPAATAFVDFLVQSGQRWWQMLPIGPTGWGDSPYQSTSAFAGNPLLLSPDRLMEKGFLDLQDIRFSPLGDLEKVDYPAAINLKSGLLKKAFGRFTKNMDREGESELDSFVDVESHWLDDFSLFAAIREKEGTSDWTRWSEEFRTRQPDALVRARKYFAHQIRYHEFVQWQFSSQWVELRSYCLSKGIGLIGDIPLFVGHQSADVWAHPDLFKLDADGNPTVVAGVPPDYFSKTGQIWGVPVYDWGELQKQDYGWWIERLRTAFRRFNLNRLDHFIGFVRTYEVPAHAKTAEKGQYQPGGGASFLEAATEALGYLPLIAEDLGIITPEVVALRDQFQLPGIRVLQFDLEPSPGTPPGPPEPRPVKWVVYTGTHDNDTTAGWYRQLPETERDALQKQLGVGDGDVVWAMIREAFASNAEAAIIPMQDLLELGSDARMNSPGTAEGNWGWRLKDGVLTSDLAQKLKKLTTTYGRLGSHKPLQERGGRQEVQAAQNWGRAEQETKMGAKQ
jgi:4-alpha-glucanotransferase